MSALETLGAEDDFAVVPLVKPGCFLAREHETFPDGAVRPGSDGPSLRTQQLQPIATVVGYRLDMYPEQ